MRGDPDLAREFSEFVSARSAALLRTAYLLVGDWGHAEDLLQTTLTKTFLAWHRISDPAAVEAYARKILVNTATSWWRRRWHGERPSGRLPETVTGDEAARHAERDELWELVRALPVRQRAVLVLRFYCDQTETETARLLGISVGTVKSQSARALDRLRRNLAHDAPLDTRVGGELR